ncbi:MAG: hypothetical protein SNJ51_20665, partial [Roseiflexus sp.]
VCASSPTIGASRIGARPPSSPANGRGAHKGRPIMHGHITGMRIIPHHRRVPHRRPTLQPSTLNARRVPPSLH